MPSMWLSVCFFIAVHNGEAIKLLKTNMSGVFHTSTKKEPRGHCYVYLSILLLWKSSFHIIFLHNQWLGARTCATPLKHWLSVKAKTKWPTASLWVVFSFCSNQIPQCWEGRKLGGCFRDQLSEDNIPPKVEYVRHGVNDRKLAFCIFYFIFLIFASCSHRWLREPAIWMWVSSPEETNSPDITVWPTTTDSVPFTNGAPFYL